VRTAWNGAFRGTTTLPSRSFVNYSRNLKFKHTTPITLGLFGWLFGTSVDYNAIRKDVEAILDDLNYDDGSWGPVFVRLAWHASGTYDKKDGTGGANGATMRFPLEANDGANNGLELARKKLEAVKAKYPEVSYADLWVLASYVAIESMGGPHIEFKSGRKDATDEKSCPPNGRLPDASKGAQHVRDVFYRMGFNDQEIVALVGGGHTLGRCHKDRSNYAGPWTRAPTTVSNEFFRVLFEEEWQQKQKEGDKPWTGAQQFENKKGKDLMMLPADLTLKSDPEFRKWSEIYHKDSDRFLKDFAAAFKKLTELGF